MNLDSPTIPEGLDLIPAGDTVIIRRVWLSWKTVPLALFAIVWDSFLFFWYSQMLSKPNPPLMAILFPIGHIAVGIGITYYVLASLVNKTDIIVSPSGVRVATGPAPWIGNKMVEADEMTAVIVRERSGNWNSYRNSRSYNVMYADRGRKERKLVAYLAQSDQAEFIAHIVRKTFKLDTTTA
jgi:hypothetical protein